MAQANLSYNKVNDPLTRLDYIREGGAVRRCHTVPINGEHRVDSHTWGLLTLILLFHPNPSLNLIKAAQFHDVTERFTGDTPAPAKWRSPELKSALDEAEAHYNRMLGLEFDLDEDELRWLKSCDMLDFALFARDQLNLGNQHARRLLRNAFNYLDGLGMPDVLAELYTRMRQRLELGDLRPINPELGL